MATSEREIFVYTAKLAEQAERYDGQSKFFFVDLSIFISISLRIVLGVRIIRFVFAFHVILLFSVL